jgi:uncharacterized protein (TIGR03083 family)
MDVQPLIHGERQELLSLLDDLDTAEWDAPSLCQGWRVRDVVGHLDAELSLSGFASAIGQLRHGFRLNSFIATTGRRWGERDPDDLVSILADSITSDRRPPSTALEGVLMDTLIHHQDIRRPLGLDRSIDEEPLRVALDHIVDHGKPLPGKKRVEGLRLVAVDIGWDHGDGPEVTGPGEALLLAIAGRGVALDELTGAGKETLAARTT